MKVPRFWLGLTAVLAGLLGVASACAPVTEPTPPGVPAAPKPFEPARPFEFVIQAGTGGGADIYARFISGIVEKHKLSPQPLLPVNRTGGAGAVAMDYTFKQKGNPYVFMITLNSFIATPLQQNLPFTFRNFTPIANLALDTFFLWVPADSPWKTVDEFMKEAKERSITVSGTESKTEDEILFRTLEQTYGLKPFKYVPFPGGGDVAKSLIGKQVEATVNNPSEAIAFYPEKARPLAVFMEKRLADWPDLPTMKELGYPIPGISDYVMMRGIFGPPDLPKDAQEWLTGLMKRVYDNEEFRGFLKKNALEPKFMAGAEYSKWIEGFEGFHKDVMRKAGWIN